MEVSLGLQLPDDRAWDTALPNALTLLRVPLAAAFWIAPGDPAWAIGVLLVAGLSDVLDGFVARHRRRVRWKNTRDPSAWAAGTGRGPFLDALCDKFFVVSVVTGIWVAVEPPVHLMLLIVARELVVAPLMVVYRLLPAYLRKGYDFTAGWPGKAATVVQFAALVAAVLESAWLAPLAWASGISGLLAVAYYLRRAIRHKKAALTKRHA